MDSSWLFIWASCFLGQSRGSPKARKGYSVPGGVLNKIEIGMQIQQASNKLVCLGIQTFIY